MKSTIHVIIALMIISAIFSIGLGISESKVIIDNVVNELSRKG